MNSNSPENSDTSSLPSKEGYASPAPEDDVPADADTNPGSPDPTLRGQESDEQSLGDDESLGAPDRNFFENEEAGSDGEPGAGRLGGTEDQLREEMDSTTPPIKDHR